MNKPDVVADAQSKATLRRHALARRNALGEAERAADSRAIAERAGEIIFSIRPENIALYLPIGSECDTGTLITQADAAKMAIGLPAVVDQTRIIFRRYQPGDRLVAGGFGTRAPAAGVPALQPEMIVVPIVAFDRSGKRLGYGRGHYDRAINALRKAGIRSKLLGIGFSIQEVETIPAEPHDVSLDWIVTEKGQFEFGTNKD